MCSLKSLVGLTSANNFMLKSNVLFRIAHIAPRTSGESVFRFSRVRHKPHVNYENNWKNALLVYKNRPWQKSIHVSFNCSEKTKCSYCERKIALVFVFFFPTKFSGVVSICFAEKPNSILPLKFMAYWIPRLNRWIVLDRNGRRFQSGNVCTSI